MADEEADEEPGGEERRFFWDSPLPTRVPLWDPSAEEELQLSCSLGTLHQKPRRVLQSMRSSRLLRGRRAIGATVNLMQFDNRPAQIVRSIRADLSTWRYEKMEHHDETEVSWEAHRVFDDVVRLLLAQVRDFNHGLVNGNARCFMRGIHRIEPVLDRLPTSGHEKVHPPCYPCSEFPLQTRSWLGLARPVDYRGNFETCFLKWRCLTQGTHRHDRKPRYLALVWFKYTFILGDGINMNFCATIKHFEYFLKATDRFIYLQKVEYKMYITFAINLFKFVFNP